MSDWDDEMIEEVNADMAAGALHAIQALLDDGGIPRGTFADDQVRNLVVLYNQRGTEIESLRADNDRLREALDITLSALTDLTRQLPQDDRLADYNLDLSEQAEEEARTALAKAAGS